MSDLSVMAAGRGGEGRGGEGREGEGRGGEVGVSGEGNDDERGKWRWREMREERDEGGER